MFHILYAALYAPIRPTCQTFSESRNDKIASVLGFEKFLLWWSKKNRLREVPLLGRIRGVRKYVIKRLLLMPVTLLGVTILVFCLTRLVPGGPAEQLMQEQAMLVMGGEKASAVGGGSVTDAERERLVEQFNLDEPAWKAYLQWLGVVRRREDITKAEFGDDGYARLTTSAADGSPRVLQVRRDGKCRQGNLPAWFEAEGWILRIESAAQRAEHRRNHSQRRGVPGAPLRARAIMYRTVWSGILQGDLGRSYKYDESVLSMMLKHLPVSLYFGILGMLVMYGVSVPLGIWKALHHGSIGERATSVLLYVGYAVPGFALGALLLVYLGARLNYFPLYGLTSPEFATMDLTGKLADIARHTVLPLCCYAVGSLALTTMMMKTGLLENLEADYMRTAIAKGNGYRRAVWRHALRNSLLPIASGLGGVVCAVVGGSILIERVFAIHGFGMLCYQALVDKDYALIMGTLLLSSFVIVLGNLASDLLVARLDPRINFR